MKKTSFSMKNSVVKRVVSMMLAIAMVITSITVFPQQTVVKAAENTVRLYFELPEGTSASDWAVNAWGTGVVVTGNSETKFRPTSWGAGDTFPTLLGDSAWGYVDISGTIDGLQFVNLAGTEYKCWNAQIAEDGLTEAYYSPADGKWYKEAAKTNAIEKKYLRLYFELPEGTSASDWAVNAWGTGVEVKGNSEIKIHPTTWDGDATLPTLLSDNDNNAWGYVDISGTIDGLQFVNLAGTEYKCWNAQIAAQELTEAYYSPEDEKWYKEATKENEVKEVSDLGTFVLAGEDKLAGSSWSITDTNNYFVQDANDSNKYSLTYKMVAAGTYGYKVVQDPVNKGWDLPWGPNGDNRSLVVNVPSDVTFSLDITDTSKNLNVDISPVKAFVVDNGNIIKGKQKELVTSVKYYDGVSAEAQDVTVSYTLKEASDDVTLTNNKITVSAASEKTSVVVIASYADFTQEITIPVVSKEYKVKINMCSADPGVNFTAGSSDVYIFENGGSKNTAVAMTGTYEDTENGVTWVTGETTIPFNSLGIIGRVVAGSWDGGQDTNKYFVIDEDAESIELWYVYGETPVTEKPTVTMAEARYLYLEYTNTTLGDVIPQFYSWTTGYAAARVDFESKGNGNYSIKVPVSPTCSKVDYVLVLDASGADWVKDGGDHSISFPLTQQVVCAKMDSGKEPVLSAPYNVGYELMPNEDKMAFYYRDDKALVDGTLSSLIVSVDINGTEQVMTYNEANKRFEYVTGLLSGKTRYRYAVKTDENAEAAYVLDKFNSNKETDGADEYSFVEYYKLNATIDASVMLPSFNYNQNNVVKFTVNQAEDEKKLEVASAKIDVSALGGSSALAIEPELQAVTIAASKDTKLGTYTLPIVVTDQYANEYTTSVDVTLVARTESGADDFDWDEAVIYFMVTDRFFDGNAANNTASGADTYGTNEGLYHGGDFAGIKAKLDYLDELGINTIWITPIVKNIPGVTVTGTGAEDVPYNAAYHGYWASDFTKLNPTLGTEEEFRDLISAAHSRGIKIMVDIVVNHAGYDTEATFGDMLRTDDEVVAGDDQKAPLSGLPDFQTEDPDVRAQLVAWQTQWIKDYDIDYFRVDTVKHVEGTTWAALKNSLTEANPEFKMIGEYAGGGYATSGGTLGTGQMDSLLDFDFNGWATSFVNGNLSSVESSMTARNAAIDNTLTTGQFLGSHDEDGFKQNLINGGMTADVATAAALVAATLQITAKGQPVIYYGEEIGLTGLNNYPYQTNRYDFDWSLVTEANTTYQHYKKMLAIRNTYTDVFAQGDRQTVTISDAAGYDVISRTYDDTTLYVGMNIKSTAQEVSIPVQGYEGNIYEDLYSGKTYVVSGAGTIKVTIPSASEGGTVVLKNTGKTTSTGGSTGADTTTPDTKPDDSKDEKPGDSDSTPTEKPAWVKDNKVQASKDKKTGITATVNTRKDGTATVTKIKKTSKKTVTIAPTVTVDGLEYTVTKIAEKAFSNAPKATKIVLPSSITTIASKAFSGAKKIKTIVVTSTGPVKVSKTAFKGLNTKNMKIQVTVSKKGMSAKEYKAFKKALKDAGFKGTIEKIK